MEHTCVRFLPTQPPPPRSGKPLRRESEMRLSRGWPAPCPLSSPSRSPVFDGVFTPRRITGANMQGTNTVRRETIAGIGRFCRTRPHITPCTHLSPPSRAERAHSLRAPPGDSQVRIVGLQHISTGNVCSGRRLSIEKHPTRTSREADFGGFSGSQTIVTLQLRFTVRHER